LLFASPALPAAAGKPSVVVTMATNGTATLTMADGAGMAASWSTDPVCSVCTVDSANVRGFCQRSWILPSGAHVCQVDRPCLLGIPVLARLSPWILALYAGARLRFCLF
jgi:hypothetical protein